MEKDIFSFQSDKDPSIFVEKKTSFGALYRTFVDPKNRDKFGSTIDDINHDRLVDSKRRAQIRKKGAKYVDVADHVNPAVLDCTPEEREDFSWTISNILLPKSIEKDREPKSDGMEDGDESVLNARDRFGDGDPDGAADIRSTKDEEDPPNPDSGKNDILTPDSSEKRAPIAPTKMGAIPNGKLESNEPKVVQINELITNIFKPPEKLKDFPALALKDMFYYFPKNLPKRFTMEIMNHTYINEVRYVYGTEMRKDMRSREPTTEFGHLDKAKSSGLFIVRNQNIGNEYCIVHCKFLEPSDDELKMEREQGIVVASDIRNDNLQTMTGESLTLFMEDVLRIYIILEYCPGSFDEANKLKKDAKMRYVTTLVTMVISADRLGEDG